jgi:predicted nucleotidyltransferase
MDDIKREIVSRLRQVEQEHQVRIFYACESGSRAWGFPSADSDYDVRFLYIHPQNWYLSIADRRDVIECPIADSIDLSGWDIRKALGLLRKSNPSLLEWLQSPVVYQERSDILERIRALLPAYYCPQCCLHHYLRMAENNARAYLKGEATSAKKCLYVLRPLLACQWIEAGYGVVPMEFERLVERVVQSTELRRAIDELVRRKREGLELSREARIPVVDGFIAAELERSASNGEGGNHSHPSVDKLDELFRWAGAGMS